MRAWPDGNGVGARPVWHRGRRLPPVEKGGRVVRRWRRRRQVEQRARLADDARRTVGLMAAMLADAERARAEVPAGVAACLTVWRSWAGRLAEWAKGGEQQ